MPWFPQLAGLFTATDELPLQIRLFRLICAATGFLCLAVILPVNALQNLPIVVKTAIIAVGLFAVFCFYASLRNRHHSTLFLIVVIGLLNPVWILNAGSQGSINQYFVVLGLYPIAIFRGPRRWIFTVLLGLNFCGLQLLEYFVPGLVVPYERPIDRFLDQLSGAFDSFLALAVIAWLIVDSHDREQRRLAESVQRLATSERSLRESKQRLAEVLHVAAEGIAVQHPNAVIEECNEAAERILNLSRDQVVGRRPVDFIEHAVHPDGSPFLPEDYPVVVTVRTRQPQQGIEMVISTDGAQRPEIWLLINTAPILDETGAVRLVVTSFSDITDRKRAEADRLMEGKLESTGVLAGGIAHDFNNLLTAVLLNIDLARSAWNSPETMRQHLRDAHDAIAGARNLTKQLITFAHGGEPIRELADLEPILRDSVRTCLGESSITTQIVVAPGLWLASADVGQIGQVFRDLLLNARDAIAEVGRITIVLENIEWAVADGPALAPGAYLRLSVADDGAGIKPEILPKIFDPYFSTKVRGVQKGMGLGLTICRSVVLKHGGAIEVDSMPGKGTTVRIHLPATRERAPESTPPVAFIPDGALDAKILVMDDDETVRNIVGMVARHMGCTVALAAEGQEAVEQYRAASEAGSPFDIVILDLTVRHGMGGAQTLRLLRALNPAVTAIVMSGYANDVTMQHYATLGFKGALQKPFDIAVLQSAIARALDK